MSAHILSTRPRDDATLRPVPWRRMGWITCRQHRGALAGAGILLGALALLLLRVGSGLHHAYAAVASCHPAGSIACGGLIGSFNGMDGLLANGFVLQAVPALIGAFVGAPVLAREFETGTFRYAWTQGFGRWRWALAKLVLLAAIVAAAAGALSALLSWYYQPYFHPLLSLTTESSPLAPGLFDLRGVALAAWTLAAFAIGAFAGTVIRRVVPAIAATLAIYTGLAFLAAAFLRPHYEAPVVTRSLRVPGSAWTISQRWLTGGGRPVSDSTLAQVLQAGSPRLAGKGGVPQSLSTWRYLVEHGYSRLTTYQPANRFWPFQWIEGAWLLGLSALLIAATVWLVRRRAT